MEELVLNKFKNFDCSIENSILLGIKDGKIIEEKCYKGDDKNVYMEIPLVLDKFDECDMFICTHNHPNGCGVEKFSDTDINTYNFFTQMMQDYSLIYKFWLVYNSEIVDRLEFTANGGSKLSDLHV